MRRVALLCSFVVMSSLSGGCALFFGLEDHEDTADSDSGAIALDGAVIDGTALDGASADGSSLDGASLDGSGDEDSAVIVPTCAADCLPTIADWTGPFPTALALQTDGGAIIDAAAPADSGCPEGEQRAFVGLQASTSCTCAPKTPTATRSCVANVHVNTNNMCNGADAIHNVTTCTPMATSYQGAYGTQVISGAGACAAPTTGTVPDAGWSGVTRMCPKQGTACAGECVKVAPGAGYTDVCIRHDGEMNCPAPYTDKHVAYQAIQDDRACQCSYAYADDNACATSGGAAASIKAYVTNNCSGALSFSLTSSCGDAITAFDGGGINSVGYDGVIKNPRCTATKAIDGGAAPAQPVTFCCTPN